VTEIDAAVRSPAKINWNLRVIGRRPDGYHEIESLVSAVTLYDHLIFTEGHLPGIELSCDDPRIPTDDRNLVCKAAGLLAQAAQYPLRLRCRLNKQIPAGGGLGGGSSNAAATLKSLNQIWSLYWPRERLLPIAGVLGSDVPFFLFGNSAIIRGRGERIEPVPLDWPGWIVLLMPSFSISTADVYRAWVPPREDLSDASESNLIMVADHDAVAMMQQTFNMLEDPAMKVCPPLRDVLANAAKLAERPVRLSGSGSTLFTAFDTQPEAEIFANRAEETLGVTARLVQLTETVE
jgi:4-diphosphocytidyl-2-C-methyl-D-erythritol kinase